MRERSRHRDDAGISLVETVVAMLVFSVFTAVVATYLVNALHVTESNSQRVTAANLANRQSELVRAARTLDLADGTTQLATQPVIAGTTYTLTQDVRFVAGPAGGSVCTGSSDVLSYKLVTTTVTWPAMGSVKPVRSDTLKTLGLGRTAADVTKGAAAVSVQRADGSASAGRTVVLQPGNLTATTGSDGCVVFPNLATGVTYTATVDEAPYVGQQGQQRLTSTFAVVAGKVVKSSLTYEPRATLRMTLLPPAGYAPPAQLGVSVDSSLLTPTPTRVFTDCATSSTAPQNCVSGTAPVRSATSLFPAVYTSWPGTCADAKPASPPATTLVAGGLTDVAGPLGGFRVTLTGNSASFVGSRTIYAFHRPTAGSCAAGEVWAMTATSVNDRRLALPPGQWDIVLNPDGSDVGTYGVSAQSIRAGLVTTLALS